MDYATGIWIGGYLWVVFMVLREKNWEHYRIDRTQMFYFVTLPFTWPLMVAHAVIEILVERRKK